MLKQVLHIGLTVSDLARSIAFYRDVLGLKFIGQMRMQGEATDKLFRCEGCIADVAYLNGSDELSAPPVELIQFIHPICEKVAPDLLQTSISELCFYVEDIEDCYQKLSAKGVEFLSEPQFFDFSKENLGKSKAVYFRDPDGIILELIQPL